MSGPWTPVLTTENTEPGKAVQLGETELNGVKVMAPMVHNDSGEPVPFDIAFQQQKLKRANNEAEARRKANDDAGKALADFFGVEFSEDREKRMEALAGHLAELPKLLSELTDLRGLRDAGSLEGNDKEAFDAAVKKASESLVAAAEQRAQDATSKAATWEEKYNGAASELNGERLRTSLTEFHRNHGAFREGTLGMFLSAAQGELEGHKWTPTGANSQKTGLPILELRDRNGNVRQDKAGQAAMTLQGWSETNDFKDLVGPLLKDPAGSNNHDLELPGGANGATATPDELLGSVNAEYAGNG